MLLITIWVLLKEDLFIFDCLYDSTLEFRVECDKNPTFIPFIFWISHNPSQCNGPMHVIFFDEEISYCFCVCWPGSQFYIQFWNMNFSVWAVWADQGSKVDFAFEGVFFIFSYVFVFLHCTVRNKKDRQGDKNKRNTKFGYKVYFFSSTLATAIWV